MKKRARRAVRGVLTAACMLGLIAVMAGWWLSYAKIGYAAAVTNRYRGDDLVARTLRVVSARGGLVIDYRVERHVGAMKYLDETERQRGESLPVLRFGTVRPSFASQWQLSRDTLASRMGLGWISRADTVARKFSVKAFRRIALGFGGPEAYWTCQCDARTLVLPYWLIVCALLVLPALGVANYARRHVRGRRGFECVMAVE